MDSSRAGKLQGGWLSFTRPKTSTRSLVASDVSGASPPRIALTEVSVRFGEYNITNEHGSSPGSMDRATLSGSFGSTRPPRLLEVTIDDEDNGDEVSERERARAALLPSAFFLPALRALLLPPAI